MTARYFEMAEARRDGHRNIGEAAKASGVSPKMIRHYEESGLVPRASADVKRLVLQHVEDLDARIAEMQSMRRALAGLAANCHGDDRPDCPILDDLSGL